MRYGSRSLLSLSRKSQKSLDSYWFVTSFWLLSLKILYMYLQKITSKKTFFKKICFLLASWRLMTKIAGSGFASGSISQRHGSADPDPDPDPHQNVTDPQHCFKDSNFISSYLFLISYLQAHYLQSWKFNFLLKFGVTLQVLFCKHYFSPLNTFLRKGKDPDPYLWLMDPDPRGPNTCNTNY